MSDKIDRILKSTIIVLAPIVYISMILMTFINGASLQSIADLGLLTVIIYFLYSAEKHGGKVEKPISLKNIFQPVLVNYVMCLVCSVLMLVRIFNWL